MEFSTAERKIIHKQLIGAKKYLWDGKGPLSDSKDRFICLAIITHVQKSNSAHSWLLAKRMIEMRLGDCVDGYSARDVMDWLIEVAKIPKEQLTDLAVQTYRHEWLDHLIKEFSE